MDEELVGTEVGTKKDLNRSISSIDEEIEETKKNQNPEIDEKVVQNLLDAYYTEHGIAGPSAALLHGMKFSNGKKSSANGQMQDEDFD